MAKRAEGDLLLSPAFVGRATEDVRILEEFHTGRFRAALLLGRSWAMKAAGVSSIPTSRCLQAVCRWLSHGLRHGPSEGMIA
jgi:hypothetical protein